MQHADSIQAVLDRTLHMTNTSAHIFSCNILERYMKSIGSVFPTDCSSVTKSLDTPLSEHLPIRVCRVNHPPFQIQYHIYASLSTQNRHHLLLPTVRSLSS